MKLIVHLADISKAFRKWDVSNEWTSRIYEEFFK